MKFIKINYIVIFSWMALFIQCEDFIEVDPPKNSLDQTYMFENIQTARAAVTSLYAMLRDNSPVSGNYSSNGFLLGIYADELDYYLLSNTNVNSIYTHQVLASNESVKNSWISAYKLIYACNVIIEGLDQTTHLLQEDSNQLKGEVLFIRAMVHFYLTNFYGDMPYVTRTDYRVNSHLYRTSHQEVIERLTADLEVSRNLLGKKKVTENIQVNSWTVDAFLARVYLYEKKWGKAVDYASSVINSGIYQLEDDLTKEFLKESTSTLFQFKPKLVGDNSNEGAIYIFEAGPPPTMALRADFVNSFETEDLRKLNWIKSVSNATTKWYMPYKYKEKYFSTTSKEYTIVMRLAEQYLIRAEASLYLGHIDQAQQDVNKIRSKAGLVAVTSSSPTELLNVIVEERRHELFTEHGHRWFDLKRWGLAEEVLKALKPNWKSTDVLFPIPESEILLNPNLNPQNSGY